MIEGNRFCFFSGRLIFRRALKVLEDLFNHVALINEADDAHLALPFETGVTLCACQLPSGSFHAS